MHSALRRRCILLLLAHGPALLLWWAGMPIAGLVCLLAVHAALLWGTLQPQSHLFGPVLRYLPVTEQQASQHQLWLTIDDGPSADTVAILQLLERYQAKAVFFLVGERAARHPDRVQAIVAAGHEVGNHSNTHPAAWFWALSPNRMCSEILRAQQVLTELTGSSPRWFRAVVGHANPFVMPVLSALGMQRVAWSVRAYDAVDGDVERVVGKLSRKLVPGAIVLLHEGAAHGQSVAIIERLLQEMRARGYQAVLPP